MTVLLWIVAVAAGWTAMSFLIAWLVGKSIHLSDDETVTERAAAMRRHPSRRDAA